MEVVAVGVEDDGVPVAVADEGFAGLEATGKKIAVEGEGILALEPERDAFAALYFWDSSGMVFLKHEGGAAVVEPTPADFVVDQPLLLEGEAEAVEVEAQGAGHVRDHKKGDDGLDVGIRNGERVGGHGSGKDGVRGGVGARGSLRGSQ